MKKFKKISSYGLLVLSLLCIAAKYLNVFWWIQLINIGLPFLLCLNILTLIWGKVAGKIYYPTILSLLIFIFASWNNWNIPNSQKPTSSKNKLSVVSYNIRLFDFYNWIERETWDKWAPRTDNGKVLDSIFDYITKLDGDVICFQEFFNQRNGDINSVNQLKKLGYKYSSIGYNLVENNNQYGMATFSRYPIIKEEKIFFDKNKSNGIIIADIVVAQDTFRVINTHLESFRFNKSDYTYFKNLQKENISAVEWTSSVNIISRLKNGSLKRNLQRKQLLDEISNSPHPVILCSDLNELPHSRTYQLINQELEDSFMKSNDWLGSTHIGPFSGFRIDYIFTHPFFKITSQSCYNTPILSDHFPIKTELSWD